MIFLIKNFDASSDFVQSNLEDVQCSLENLAMAHYEGKHIVLCSSSLVAKILQACQLSPRAVSTYNLIAQQFTNFGGLRDHVTCYANVVFEEAECPPPRAELDQTVLDVPVRLLGDSELVQPTRLLAENIDDSVFYHRLAEAFTKASTTFSAVKIQSAPVPGGGDTTADNIGIGKSMCVCIVDSDRCEPEAPLGSTAKKFKKVGVFFDNHYASVTILKAREVENLLASRLIEDAYANGDVIDRLQYIKLLEEHSHDRHWRLYFDFKEGMSGSALVGALRSSAGRAVWQPFLNALKDVDDLVVLEDCKEGAGCVRTACDCISVPGLSNNVLSKVVEHIKRITAKKLSEYLDFSEENIATVSLQVTSWCCSFDKVRV